MAIVWRVWVLLTCHWRHNMKHVNIPEDVLGNFHNINRNVKWRWSGRMITLYFLEFLFYQIHLCFEVLILRTFEWNTCRIRFDSGEVLILCKFEWHLSYLWNTVRLWWSLNLISISMKYLWNTVRLWWSLNLM